MALNAKTAKLRDGMVWIELHPHLGDEEFAKRQCEAANRLLRLMYGPDTPLKFWVGGHKGLCYNFTTSEAGTYRECVDRGEWFKVPEETDMLANLALSGKVSIPDDNLPKGK